METTQAPVNPYSLAPDSKKKLMLIGIFFCIFGSMLQSGTLSTMLPLAANDIGGVEYYSLATTVTGVVSIAAMPLYGYLAARSPEIKRTLMAVSYFIGAAVVLVRMFAPHMMVIVIAMLFWGVVSPATFVLGYSVIRDMYDRSTAGKYLGVCGTLMMLANLLGPIGGGGLMTALGWRSLNMVIWPIMLIGGVLVLMGVKVTKEDMAPFARKGSSFDTVGTIGLTIFLAGLILGLSLGTNLVRFGTTGSFALFGASLVGLVILIFAMRKRQGEAIIPTPALKNRNVVAFTLANFFGMFSTMALFFFLPSYIINSMGGNGLQAGIAMACMSLIGVFLGPAVGKSIGKAGSAKKMLSISAVLRMVVAAVLILYLSPDANYYVICAIMLIAGFYNITHSVSFSAGPQVQLPEDLRVQGNAVIQTGQNLGSGVGTAFYSVIIGLFGFTGGMPISIGFSILFAAATLVCALFLRPLQKEGGQA